MTTDAPHDATPELPKPRWPRPLLLEMGAVGALTVLTYIASACISLAFRVPAAAPFAYDMLIGTLMALQVVPALLLIMWRSGDAWSCFGIVRPRWRADLILAVVAAVACEAAFMFCAGILLGNAPDDVRHSEWPWGFRRSPMDGGEQAAAESPRGVIALGLIVLMSLATGLSEELTMRAYFIPRFERLLGSSAWAIIATSLLFGAYHVYQSAWGVLGAVLTGLVMGVVFCATRRLWPVALGHALLDMVAYLRIWEMG